MNIALISPNYNAVSETFIKNHKENLPGNIYYYYGGLIPTALEGVGNFRKQFYNSRLNRYKRKFLNINRNDELFFEESLIKNKIDLVFAEFGNTGASVYPICKKLDLPLIITWLGYEISIESEINKFQNKYIDLFKSNSKHIIVSNTMKNKLIELGAKEKNIFYSPLAGNEIFLNCKPNYDSQNIVSVGRFVDKKAPYNLILSMNEVVKDFPNCKLKMVGDGVLFNTCFNLINSLGLQKNIELIGNKNLEEIIDIFNDSSIFIQHSLTALNGDSEGTPVALLEASMAALPVVSTFHSGISEVIINNKSGFLVEENNYLGFADKIMLLLNNSKLKEDMGLNGRDFINNNFSEKKHLALISHIIKVLQID